MRWDAISASEDKRVLARALVALTPRLGWRRAALEQAARQTLGQPDAWRRHFPNGARDAIWFISEISDASMAQAFAGSVSMSAVIRERLDQNADLKPFVRRVMIFDCLHPLQALARMQRTACVMFTCGGRPTPSFIGLTALNLTYTGVVFFWLYDRSPGDALTHKLTRKLMRALRL